MVKDIQFPAKECNLKLCIRKPQEVLYVCECYLQCNKIKKRLGIGRLEDFVEDFTKGIVSEKDSFVTLLGSTCAVSVQHRKDHIIFKYVDADNNPIGSSVLDEADKNKWIEILAELKALI